LKRSGQNLNGSQSAALNKLGEDFLDSLSASFEAKGAQAIRRVCEENPRDFLEVVVGRARKELEPNGNELDHHSPEELNRMLVDQIQVLSKLNEA
jgi:hypothetical protein